VDAQYPSKILNGFSGVHSCVAWKTLQTFFLLDQLDEGEHSNSWCFSMAVRVLCCPPRKEFHKNICLNL